MPFSTWIAGIRGEAGIPVIISGCGRDGESRLFLTDSALLVCFGEPSLDSCVTLCLIHQTWWRFCAAPTKTGGNSAPHPPKLVEKLHRAHQNWWKFRAAPTKTGGNYVLRPPKLVEISCSAHQNWWKNCAAPTKPGGKIVPRPPKLVETAHNNC